MRARDCPPSLGRQSGCIQRQYSARREAGGVVAVREFSDGCQLTGKCFSTARTGTAAQHEEHIRVTKTQLNVKDKKSTHTKTATTKRQKKKKEIR